MPSLKIDSFWPMRKGLKIVLITPKKGHAFFEGVKSTQSPLFSYLHHAPLIYSPINSCPIIIASSFMYTLQSLFHFQGRFPKSILVKLQHLYFVRNCVNFQRRNNAVGIYFENFFKNNFAHIFEARMSPQY